MKSSEALALGVGIGGAAVVTDHIIKNLPPFGEVMNVVALLYCRQNNPDEFDRFVMNSVRDEWRLTWSFRGITSLPSVGRPIVVREVWENFFRSHGIALTDAETERIEQKLVMEFWNSAASANVDLDLLKRVSGDSLARRSTGRRKGGKKRNSFQTLTSPKLLEAHVEAHGETIDNDLPGTATAFLKALHKSNSALTERSAMKELKRIVEPLIAQEFRKPPKPPKKKITTKTQRVRMLALWNQQIAVQKGCEVEEAAASTEPTRVQFSHWMRIVRTELPPADREKIEAVRTEVYAERRESVLTKPDKRKRTKSKKLKR